MSLGSLIQPQVAGGSHLSALGQQQALADASSSQPANFRTSRRTSVETFNNAEDISLLLFDPFREFQNATRFWGGGTTRHKYVRPYARQFFGFDATEEAKYLQAHGLKQRQLQYSLHEPSRYEDACFDGASTVRFLERRYPGANFCRNPGYLRVHREGGVRSENRRYFGAHRNADGEIVEPMYENFLGRSPGWPGTGHRARRATALTFSEYLLTLNTERERTVSQGGFFESVIRTESNYLTNAIRKLGYNNLTQGARQNQARSDYARAGYGYYSRNLLGHEYDQVSLEQAREFQTAYDTRDTNPDLYDALDKDLKIRMLIKIGDYNHRINPVIDRNPATNPFRYISGGRDSDTVNPHAPRPSIFLDSLIAGDALLRLEYFDDCLSLDDVFSQRCGKFDPYRNNHNGDFDYRDIVLREGTPFGSQLYRAARQRFHVAYDFRRGRGQPDGTYNPYNLPDELISDVSRRDNPY